MRPSAAPLVLALLLASPATNAQKRNNNWVMGRNTWVSFNTGTFELLPMSYQPSDRSGCISDTAGNFLILADSLGVHDALFDVMPGGDAAALGWGDRQSNFMILPKPGAPDSYIVLVNLLEDQKMAGWVEVDMSQNGGLGAVVSPSTTWYMDSTTSKLAAIPHANGTDYWIVQHEDGTDEFYSFLLTSAGVDPVPVITHSGTDFLPTPATTSISMDFWGPMRLSSNGELLAMVTYGPEPDTTEFCEIHRFNSSTGGATYVVSLHDSTRSTTPGLLALYLGCRWWTGLDFDPTSQYLYLSVWDSIGYPPCGGQSIFQIALDTLDPDVNKFYYIGGNGEFLPPVSHDPLGPSLTYGADGTLYVHGPRTAPSLILRGLNLPTYYGDPAIFHLLPLGVPMDTHLHGFPNQCKHYADDPPLPMNAGTGPSLPNDLRVRPNPLADRAVLDLGGGPWPDQVIWRDALGRTVRVEAARMDGPSVILERLGLPCGVYTIVALRSNALIGRARVVCE